MQKIQKKALVQHSAEEMYALVNDVAEYPDFLPSCHGARVIAQDEHQLKAELVLGKGKLEKAFTTVNELHPPHKMVMHLVDGPFKHLQGVWLFHEKGPDLCEVELDLEFEFSNKLLAMMFGPVFQQTASHLVDAFKARATAVYGD